jgi:hypothetical protein
MEGMRDATFLEWLLADAALNDALRLGIGSPVITARAMSALFSALNEWLGIE